MIIETHEVFKEALQLCTRCTTMSEMELDRQLRLRFSSALNLEAVITAVLSRLKSLKVLSDSRTAAAIARRHENKGDRLIRQKLKWAGISEACSAAALAELGDELQRAKEAALKKIRGCGNISASEKEKQLIRFLASRGFSAETCCEIVKRVCS